MSRPICLLAFVATLALSLTACDSAGTGLEGASASGASAQQAPSASTPYLSYASESDFSTAYSNATKMTADQAAQMPQGPVEQLPEAPSPDAPVYGAAAPTSTFISMAGAEIADIERLERGEIGENDVRQSVVEDPFLASIVSVSGVVKIGTAVYKVGPTQVFKGTTANLADFNTKSEAELAGRYESSAISRTGDVVTSANAFQFRCSSSFSASGKTYKACGTSFITNWPWILHSAGASTKVLKKWWFLYFPTKGDNLVLTATHRVVAGAGALPAATTVTTTGTNSYIHAKIYKFAIGGSDFRGSVSSTHRGTEGGVTGTTTTSVSLP